MWAMWGQPAPGQAKQTLFPLVAVPAGVGSPGRPGRNQGGRGVTFSPHTPQARTPPGGGGVRAHTFARNPPPPSRASLGLTRHDETDALGRAGLGALHEPPGFGEFEKAGGLGMGEVLRGGQQDLIA